MLLLLLLATGSLFAQYNVEERINKVITALNTKNSDALINEMDDSCKIANLPRGQNKAVVPVLLHSYRGIKSYKIVQQINVANGIQIFLDVIYENGAPGHPWFLLNDSKILEMHIIKDIVVNKEDDLGKATISGKLPDIMTVHFHLYNNLIYVDAEVNGDKGLFQLDSGSPVILLNKRLFPDAKNATSVADQVNLTGLGGKFNNVVLKQIDTLKWDAMELYHFKAAGVEMADQDNNGIKQKVFGLLGYEVFKDYEITFDYLKRTLTLIKVDATGNYLNKKVAVLKPVSKAAIVMQRHIPILQVAINGKAYNLGIDCGANANVLFSKYYEELKPLLSEPIHQQITTADGEGDTQTCILKTASVNGLIFKNMFTSLSDDKMYMPRPESKLHIDGLLGEPFLSQYQVTINFNKAEIRFY